MVSNIRHLQLNDPLLETKRHRMVVVNFPDSFCGIPFAARLFDTTLQLGFVEFNSQSDNLRLLRWRPAGFVDDDFDSSEAFAPLFVIAITDADQLFALTFKGLLCAFLTVSQCPPSLHKRHS
jgi:hypothetical protein